MPARHRAAPLAALLAAALLVAAPAAARTGAPQAAAAPAATARIIVQLREPAAAGESAAAAAGLAERLAGLAGAELAYAGAGAVPGMHLLRLPAARPLAEVAALAARIAASPEVAYAEPDRLIGAARTPSDPLYAGAGWHLQPVTPTSYGANLPPAWEITTGDPSVVVAVIDTGGLLGHEDLVGRTVAGNPGYDMISSPAIANDGGARDASPADPGDWIDASDTDDEGDPLVLEGCPIGYTDTSSWHGSHVAGTIGASANNAKGVAGITWGSKLLHMRALGRCGGFTSDIAAAIRWAAGLSVPGLPANPSPARVINMSLGGAGACDATTQGAISAARAAGAVIVVAAGNEELDLDAPGNDVSPAECAGVITVAASTQSGGRAYYSNYGSTVEIAAPGGGPVDSSAPSFGPQITSTIDQGLRGPEGDAYGVKSGTSMAAPHVAGVVALMLSVNPSLTPDQVLSILRRTATAFPAGSNCSAGGCGAGILNAGRAVEEAALTVGWRDAGQVVNEGAGVANIPLRLSAASGQTITVPYTVSGSAGAGDHALAAGTVSFAPGVTSAKLSFAITDDAGLEPDESIVVTLGTPLGSPAPARVAPPAAHTITLLDNDGGDPVAELDLAAGALDETTAAVTLSFTVARSGPAGAVGVSYRVRALAAGGAASTLLEGELSLAAAATTKSASVTLSRGQVGFAEALLLELSAPTGGAVLGADTAVELPLTPLSRVFLPLTAR